MLTLDRYIARQVVVPALAGLALLLLLFSVFTAVRLLRGEATGNLALHDILWLVVAHDLSAMAVSYTHLADAPGRWAFHCHLLFHMDMGMFRVVRVS